MEQLPTFMAECKTAVISTLYCGVSGEPDKSLNVKLTLA